MHVGDWTPELLGEERIETDSEAVDTWAAALELLDRYPWVNLYAMSVHPDFRQNMWDALQERVRTSTERPAGQAFDRSWLRICGSGPSERVH